MGYFFSFPQTFYPFHCFHLSFFYGFVSLLKSGHQDETPFQLWSQQYWCTGITVRALHKAVLFTDTRILVFTSSTMLLACVQLVTNCNPSSLFLHSCLLGTRLKEIGENGIFLNLQSMPVFGIEITPAREEHGCCWQLGRAAAFPQRQRALPSARGSSEPAPGLSRWAFSLHLLPSSCICCLFLVLSLLDKSQRVLKMWWCALLFACGCYKNHNQSEPLKGKGGKLATARSVELWEDFQCFWMVNTCMFTVGTYHMGCANGSACISVNK